MIAFINRNSVLGAGPRHGDGQSGGEYVVMMMERRSLTLPRLGFAQSVVFAAVVLPTFLVWAAAAAGAQNTPPPCPEVSSGRTTIELSLSKHAKTRAGELKQAFQSGLGPLNVRIVLTPLANPPTNLGIGRCVEADVARNTIRVALSHGIGVDRLVFQEILPHHWILMGTTQVAELSWTPITPAELEQLLDSTLSTQEFQNLYRKLATPKERKRPFGFDPVPFEPAPHRQPR